MEEKSEKTNERRRQNAGRAQTRGSVKECWDRSYFSFGDGGGLGAR